MPPKINPNEVQWDSAPAQAIDPAQVQWDAPASPSPSMGDVALNAIPKGVANLINTPVALFNLGKAGLEKIPGVKPSPDIENYPMKAMEYLGLVDPNKNPQTAAQRVIDTMIQSGIGMVGGPGGVVKNALTGVVAGGAGQATKELTGSDAAGAAVSLATPFLLRRTANPEGAQRNAVRDSVLQEGRKAGYVVPATEVNPSMLQNTLESIGGKAALKQEATLRNQAKTTSLSAQELGMPKHAPLTPGPLAQGRLAAGQPYEEVANLRPTASTPWFSRYHQTDLVEQMKQKLADANNIRKGLLSRNDPGALQKAKDLEAEARSIQSDLQTLAQSNGRPDLVQKMLDARTKVGKFHDVENATNLVGEVSAADLARMGADKKLSGNLDMIARFQSQFPKFMGEGTKTPTPGVSALEPYAGYGLGASSAAMNGPTGWMAAGVPLVRGPVRSMLLSPAYQRYFASPDYGGLTPREKLIEGLLATRGYVGAQ